MRVRLQEAEIDQLIRTHLTFPEGTNVTPDQLIRKISQAYYAFLDSHHLDDSANDKTKWYEEEKFAKIINSHLPDQIRLEQNRIYPLLVEKSFKPRAGVLILRNNQTEVLLVQDSRTRKYGLPKGRIEEGESPEACAIRETKEETGLDVELGQKIEFKRHKFETFTFFKAKIVNTNPEETQKHEGNPNGCWKEITDERWVSSSEINKGIQMNGCTKQALYMIDFLK